MRTDRRRYVCVHNRALLKLLDADKGKRDRMHAQLLQWEESINGQRRTMRPERKASANAQDRADRRI
jgi:hypothetical protein